MTQQQGIHLNMHYNQDILFLCSCLSGQLEIAQWLYQLGGVDIHTGNNGAFRAKKKEIVNWLYHIDRETFWKTNVKSRDKGGV